MPWIGSFVTVPGLLSGHVDSVMKVRDFDAQNTLTNVTWRVTDPPVGGTVVIEVHDQADLGGNSLSATIADGEVYISQDGTLTTGGSIWQVITTADDDAMSLSGEYTMSSASGITDYFTTLALVKLAANIATVDADRDTVLTAMIAGVTRQMQDWMEREIVQGTATNEKISGWYDSEIYTRHYPITNFTALTENGTALVEDTDYESTEGDQEVGRVVRISGGYPVSWSSGTRNIAITYDHGYTAVPDSLVAEATKLVVAKFNETMQSGKGWGGLLSQGVAPNDTVTFDKEIWTRDTIPVMQRYLRRSV